MYIISDFSVYKNNPPKSTTQQSIGIDDGFTITSTHQNYKWCTITNPLFFIRQCACNFHLLFDVMLVVWKTIGTGYKMVSSIGHNNARCVKVLEWLSIKFGIIKFCNLKVRSLNELHCSNFYMRFHLLKTQR